MPRKSIFYKEFSYIYLKNSHATPTLYGPPSSSLYYISFWALLTLFFLFLLSLPFFNINPLSTSHCLSNIGGHITRQLAQTTLPLSSFRVIPSRVGLSRQ